MSADHKRPLYAFVVVTVLSVVLVGHALRSEALVDILRHVQVDRIVAAVTERPNQLPAHAQREREQHNSTDSPPAASDARTADAPRANGAVKRAAGHAGKSGAKGVLANKKGKKSTSPGQRHGDRSGHRSKGPRSTGHRPKGHRDEHRDRRSGPGNGKSGHGRHGHGKQGERGRHHERSHRGRGHHDRSDWRPGTHPRSHSSHRGGHRDRGHAKGHDRGRSHAKGYDRSRGHAKVHHKSRGKSHGKGRSRR